MDELIRVWPLVVFMLVQAGGFLFWMGRVTGDIGTLKKHSDGSAKNGERLANMEGVLEGILSSIENIQNNMPKRRGS